ncbi:hypothetical protein ACWGDE_24220 [Streptomyces sp. NPDC054956]
MQKGTHTMGITLGGRKRTAVYAATFALLIGGLATGIAQGATGSATAATTVPGTVVVKEDAHAKVLTADASVRNKRDLVKQAREQRAAQRQTPKPPAPAGPQAQADGGGGGHGDQSGFAVRDQWLTSSKSERITVPGGGQGELTASGASFVKVPFMEYYAIFTANSSDVAWLGGRPFNADSIEHTDNWRIGSVGAPFWVVGAPQGAAVKSTGSLAEASWTTSVQNNWYSEHAYDQVAFYPPSQDDYSNVFRISHSVTGTFQFGSSFFTVTSQDRSYS